MMMNRISEDDCNLTFRGLFVIMKSWFVRCLILYWAPDPWRWGHNMVSKCWAINIQWQNKFPEEQRSQFYHLESLNTHAVIIILTDCLLCVLILILMVTSFAEHNDTEYGDKMHNRSRIRQDVCIQWWHLQTLCYQAQNFNHILQNLEFLYSAAEIAMI
jgi:hypothetical protein